MLKKQVNGRIHLMVKFMNLFFLTAKKRQLRQLLKKRKNGGRLYFLSVKLNSLCRK